MGLIMASRSFRAGQDKRLDSEVGVSKKNMNIQLNERFLRMMASTQIIPSEMKRFCTFGWTRSFGFRRSRMF